jgi:tape measure domain-containing protein
VASKNDVVINVVAETKQAIAGFAKFALGIGSATLAMKKLADGIMSSLKFAAEIEQKQVAFKTLLGNASEASRLFKDITDFSAKTPFQLDNLTTASQRLLAFGTESENVIEKLENLGNAAQGDSFKLDRLVDSYGKVQAKGRASLEELNRFTEAGVPLMAELAKNLNMTTAELFKFVSEGKVGFKEVDDALTSLTTGEGKFAGLLEAQSQTLKGSLSTLQDNIKLLGAEIVTSLKEPLTDSANALTDVIRTFREIRETARIAEEGIGIGEDASLAERVGAYRIQLEALGKQIAYLSDVYYALDKAGADTFETKRELIKLTAKQAELNAILTSSGRGLVIEEKKQKAVNDLKLAMDSANAAMETYNAAFFPEPELTRLEKAKAALTDIQTQINLIASLGGTDFGKLGAFRDAIRDLIAELEKQTDFTGNIQNTFGPQTKEVTEFWDSFIPDPKFEMQGRVDGITELVEEISDATRNFMTPPTEEQSNFWDRFTPTEEHVFRMQGMVDAVDDVASSYDYLTQMIGMFSPAQIRAQKEQDEALAKTEAAWQSIKDSIVNTLSGSTMDLLENFGKATASIGKDAYSSADAIEDFKSSIINALPQLLFQGGMALLNAGLIEPGLVMLAASGIAAIGKGIYNEQNKPRESQTYDTGSSRTNTTIVAPTYVYGSIMRERDVAATVYGNTNAMLSDHSG